MPDTPIPLATSSTYTLVTGDIPSNIFCRVTAHNSVGDASADSNTVGPVVAAGGDVTAPTITSSASVSNAENSVLAHTLTANETVTWSFVGGADSARFELSGSTLRWLSNGTKDFEAPNDADANNAYIVQVRATDTASNTTNQTITVTVTDVVEGSSPALTNMYSWLKADAGVYSDAGTTPATNGGTVARWADQSATGTRHFNQTTAGNRPTWQTNAINTTLPVVRFTFTGVSGTNSWLLGPDATGLTGTAGEIFIVLKKAGADPGDGSGATLWQCDGHGSANLYPFSDSNIYDGWGCSIRNNCGDPTPSLTTFRLYNVVSTMSEWTNYIDGTLQFALGSGNATFGVFYLGRDEAASSSFSGDIAELIFYSAKCSAPDKAQTKAYLAAKYGLTVA